MKSQERLIRAIESMELMTRGRLCVLSRAKSGGEFYHLQYRKDTKLHQRYVPQSEASLYEKSTEAFRNFMRLVDEYVDEVSERSVRQIKKEVADAKRKSAKKTGGTNG